jgi:hypothetical protein
MGRKSSTAPFSNLATAKDVDFFEQTSKRGPTSERFRVSLSGRLASAWNKRAAEVFANDFITSKWYRCQDQAFLQRAFRTHLIQLRNQYTAQQSFQTADSEAEDERSQALSDGRKKMARNARRRSVGASQVEPALMCADHKSLAAMEAPR